MSTPAPTTTIVAAETVHPSDTNIGWVIINLEKFNPKQFHELLSQFLALKRPLGNAVGFIKGSLSQTDPIRSTVVGMANLDTPQSTFIFWGGGGGERWVGWWVKGSSDLEKGGGRGKKCPLASLATPKPTLTTLHQFGQRERERERWGKQRGSAARCRALVPIPPWMVF